MEKNQKIIIVLSISIIIVTTVVVGLFAPFAFEEQCKQNFLASYEKGTISNRSHVELQKLDMVLSNCPELKSTSTKESDYDISFLRG